MCIKDAGFDSNTIYGEGGTYFVLGAVDGLLVKVQYSHDYDLVGESWQGGPVIEDIRCPASDAKITLDREDEILMEALDEADQSYMARKSGYA